MQKDSAEPTIQRQFDLLNAFVRGNLTSTISQIENTIAGQHTETVKPFLSQHGINPAVLGAAADVKRAASQIDVVIHALGILQSLPHILKADEIVQSVSLGAGNTGRHFDLETNFQVAEFKFIAWKGGAEAIRQNGIFKDFFDLARAETNKRKVLYVLGTEHPLKFLNGGRALSSVLSKNQTTRDIFYETYGDRYQRVRDYYKDHCHLVEVIDASPWLPDLCSLPLCNQ